MNKVAWTETLPDWAVWNEETQFVDVDPDVVYPMFLELLGQPTTQVGLELARRAFTKVLRDKYCPKGTMLHLRILQKDEKWALKHYPHGEGELPTMG